MLLYLLLNLSIFVWILTHFVPTLRETCLYSEFCWSLFSRIWPGYRYLQSKSPFSVRMRDNTSREISNSGTFYAELCFPVFCINCNRILETVKIKANIGTQRVNKVWCPLIGHSYLKKGSFKYVWLFSGPKMLKG